MTFDRGAIAASQASSFTNNINLEWEIPIEVQNSQLSIDFINNQSGSLYASATVTGNPEQVWVKLSYPNLDFGYESLLMNQTADNFYELYIPIDNINFPSGIIQGKITAAQSISFTNDINLEWEIQVSYIQLDVSERIILARKL